MNYFLHVVLNSDKPNQMTVLLVSSHQSVYVHGHSFKSHHLRLLDWLTPQPSDESLSFYLLIVYFKFQLSFSSQTKSPDS